MASGMNVRDSDTSLWLHNKLGTSNDLWSGGSIISQLNQDVLRNIRECFADLQSQVKLKLLLSFLHVSRRNVDEWKNELDEIIEVASSDGDQWVSMLAELLKNYPSDTSINWRVDGNALFFSDLLIELKKIVKKHGEKGILPLECLYLNKNALNAQVGHLSQPVKHFTLRRKPKSAALRAELLQKSNDAATGRKSVSGPSVPIRCRGIANDSNTPLRGIPSRNLPPLQSGFKTPNSSMKLGANRVTQRIGQGGKRDGGIKLLDITEQPLGRDAKRRKKAQPEDSKQKENEKVADQETKTPDYAAGLTSTVPPSPAPSYAPPATPAPQPVIINDAMGSTQNIPQRTIPITKTETENLVPSEESRTQPVLQQLQLPQPASTTTIAAQPQIQIVQQNIPQIQVHLQAQPQSQQQQSQQPRRQLQLSREQMVEAQEMFRNSNKVTRPEKALILGFMAGSRDNPCPQLGNVVTIKLSEKEELVQQTDGTFQNMMVETHFQMNYSTGEWKKVRKYRKIDVSQQTISLQNFPSQQTV